MGFFKTGLKDGIPIFLGYLAVSFTFGIVAGGSGVGPWPATLMSATNFTSAGQFAALGLIAGGASYGELALSQLVINLRYCLMSSVLAQKLAPGATLPQRLVMAFGVTDEMFGMASTVPGALSPWYAYGLMCSFMPGWVLGTLLGGVVGGLLPWRLLNAFGVALYGMFIAIVVPPAKGSRVVAGLVVVAMLLSCLFAFLPVLSGISAGMRTILLTLLVAGAAAVLFPVANEAEGEARHA